MKSTDLQIISMPNKVGRYMIVDVQGVIVSDAGGYGFKTVQSAEKGIWWECTGRYIWGNGKEKRGGIIRTKLIDTNLPGAPF